MSFIKILFVLFIGAVSVINAENEGTIGALLQDLVAESGVDTLTSWFAEKVKNNDPEMLKMINWLQGSESEEIFNYVCNLPEYQRVNEALIQEGVDFQKWAVAIQKFLGIPRPLVTIDDSKGRLFDMLNAAVLSIDLNHFLAILEEKVENDPAVAKVAGFIEGEDWTSVVAQLQTYAPFQNLIKELKSEGVDLLAIYDVIKAVVAV